MWAIFKRNEDLVRSGIKTEKGAKKIASRRGHAIVGCIIGHDVYLVQRKLSCTRSQSWAREPWRKIRV